MKLYYNHANDNPPDPRCIISTYTFFLSCLVMPHELIRSHLLVLPRACTRILVPSFFSRRTIFPREGTGINRIAKPPRFTSFSPLLEFRSIIQRFGNARVNPDFPRILSREELLSKQFSITDNDYVSSSNHKMAELASTCAIGTEISRTPIDDESNFSKLFSCAECLFGGERRTCEYVYTCY